MRLSFRSVTTVVLSAAASVLSFGTVANALPWVEFADDETGIVCDLVNAADTELVVLEDTGELAVVSGEDFVFADTFVDADGLVFFQGLSAGYIAFEGDADGVRSLWWFTDFDDLASVNPFTGEPTSSGLFPFDFAEVPCDACPFWDFPDECVDSDDDGIEDAFDLCDLTPFDEAADVDGCSCSQVDDDLDGIDNCFDLCPDTPFDLVPDVDGCACEELDGDFDGINACFDLCPNTPEDELADIDGCSCSQVDDDGDGVNNCFDVCPGTPLSAAVDIDGCSIGGAGPVINLCGSFNAVIFAVMLCGLTGMRRHLCCRRRIGRANVR